MTRLKLKTKSQQGLAVFVLFLLLFSASGFAENSNSGRASGFAQRADQILYRIGSCVKRKIPQLAEAINKTSTFDLSVSNIFYDRHLRRIFFEFKGKIYLRKNFPTLDKSFLASSDGLCAFDVFCQKPVLYRSAKVIDFNGDIIISLDKILYELAKDAALFAGAAILDQAGELIIDFLHAINSKFLADAISESVSRFSREAIAISGAEIIHNASRANNPKLVQLIKLNWKNGDILTFTAFTIIKSGTLTVAKVSGGALGTVVGNIVAPGPGGLIGAYIGGKIVADVAKVVIQTVTVDIPINIYLKKIVKFHQRLTTDAEGEYARLKLKNYQNFISKKVKKEVDDEEYHTFDGLLKKIGEFPATDRPAFVDLLKDIQEILRFKLMEGQDWYASKKLLQLRENLKKWHMQQHFSY